MPDDASQAYHRVPIESKQEWTLARGGRFGVTVEAREIEVGVPEHLTWVLIGIAITGLAYYSIPGTVGIAAFGAGMFIIGWALNNLVVAWRCDRVEVDDE